MTPDWLQATLDWVSQHSAWAGTIVFLVAMAESMLVVGVVVPGALMMIGFGALIALGALELWSTLVWAIAGAVVGDGISFWIGYVFKDRLRTLWPFAKHPQMLDRGQAFFARHGGKSVVFGRFVGPVRAVIPTIAGIMGMSPMRFTIINVLSAIAWAPAYILPGMVVGVSLGLASQVAARLGILLLLVLVLGWLVIWSVRSVFNFVQPRAARWFDSALAWSRAHPRFGRLASGLLDPQRPEAAALSGLAAILLFAAWAFLWLMVQTARDSELTRLDESVYHILQSLRTPWADQLMVAVSQLGDAAVAVPLTVGVLAVLLLQRQWLAAAHWLAAVGFAGLLTLIIKQSLQIPRPAALYEGLSTYAFPSGHTALATAMYGFLAVMLTHAAPAARRWMIYAAASVMVLIVAFSRLYLGAHWLSDVLGGFTLGLVWVALLGIAFRRHAQRPLHLPLTAGAVVVILAGAAAVHIGQRHAEQLERYAASPTLQHFDADAWQSSSWRTLPAFRSDIKGEELQPLTIQWAGELDAITATLRASGWKPAPPFRLGQTLLWLTPNPDIEELPVLPKLHNGRREALVTRYQVNNSGEYLVLRLWPADATIGATNTPLWTGFVADLQIAHLPLVAYARSSGNFSAALDQFAATITERTSMLRVARSPVPRNDNYTDQWQGEVVLLHTAPATVP